jgi:DNA polymerase/3'-5' exonuclease PolX
MVNQVFSGIIQQYKIPVRMPPELFLDLLNEKDRTVVILEHIDYLLKLKGRRSTPYGYAAWSVSQQKAPLSSMKHELRKLKGVGKTTERIIREIIETGNSSYYMNLLNL